MRICYPGSFDPLSNGHLDIIKRLSKNFSEVVILISNNINKHYTFSVNERKEMIELVTKDLKNVKIDIYNGLVVNYCAENQSVCPSTTIPFWTQWGGNFVIIRTPHPEDNTKDMFIGYFHLREGNIYVKPGDKVTKGQVIALPGNTGNSYGIHHHVTLNIVNKGTPFTSAGGNTLVDPIMIFCGVPGTEKHSACTI